MHDRAAEPGPRPVLRVRDAVAITVGIVIGAGIFRTPSIIAGAAGSGEAMLLAWLLGGAISIVGALCYAELASAWPGAGGDYGFLRRAFGPRFAFLYGWARLSVIQTGSVALLAFVVGDYLAAVVSFGPATSAVLAAAVVVGLTAINWIGVRAGVGTQAALTLIEVAALVAVIVAGLWIAPAAPAMPPPSATTGWGLVMVMVLLTFGGWNEAVYVTGELKDARRRFAPVLLVSLGLITLIYVATNLAYLRALGLAGMAASDAVAAEVMRRAFGEGGAALIALAVAIAALTSANATMFTGARTNWALGRDVPALRFLGRWDAVRGTPGNALLVQGAVALALVVAGGLARDGFRLAVEYTAPVFWFFFLAAGIAVFVLRVREPDAPRPFRVPLYPLLPALFCAANAWLLWSSLAHTGAGALVGAGVLAAGALLIPFVKPRETIR